MYYRYKSSLLALACILAVSVTPISSGKLSAEPKEDSSVAARGGGGGRGGGDFHGGGNFHDSYRGGEGMHSDYHNNYNHSNQNWNHDNNWNRNAAWDAGYMDGAGGAYVAPQGEYVLPTPSSTSGDMDTLYDYDNSINPTPYGN